MAFDPESRRAYQRTYYKNNPRAQSLRAAACRRYRRRLRRRVFQRDDYTCVYCLTRKPAADLELDHRRPASRGGSFTFGNLFTACKACNRERGDMPWERFMLLRQTGAPF